MKPQIASLCIALPCSYHDNLHTNMQLPVLYYSVLYCTVLQFTGLVCTQYLLVTFLHPHPAQVRNIKQSSGYKQQQRCQQNFPVLATF